MGDSEIKSHLHNQIPWVQHENVQSYFDNERSFMASVNFSEDEAAKKCRYTGSSIIFKILVSGLDQIGPFLALNYLDRSIGLARNDHDDVEIIANSCLTLASKMIENNFKSSNSLFQRPELLTVTELRIADHLEWRLCPITAFNFVPYIYSKFETVDENIKERTREIIIYAHYDTHVTEFRPSVLAASAFLAAFELLYPEKRNQVFLELSSDPLFDQSDLNASCEAMIHGWLESTLKMTEPEGQNYNDNSSWPAMDGPGRTCMSNDGSSGPSDRKEKKVIMGEMTVPVIAPAAEERKDSKEKEQFEVEDEDEDEQSPPASHLHPVVGFGPQPLSTDIFWPLLEPVAPVFRPLRQSSHNSTLIDRHLAWYDRIEKTVPRVICNSESPPISELSQAFPMSFVYSCTLCDKVQMRRDMRARDGQKDLPCIGNSH